MSYLKFAKDLGITGITNALVALSGLVTLPILTKVIRSLRLWDLDSDTSHAFAFTYLG
ncbi:hypothetical protein [Syntrophaceticus schinkii]|uniref:Uncharacterized protein n=1 Tax=Syntrophaceticus schinkii TaxID=499207 RepID=A0A0B7ML44_9FIRM|nr:hypothetical protein [Syntrophaceticus schinkii]CEO88407.1 hypothetical protein SSCH_1830003 [Syntrophaceticus schinkii]